MTALDDLLGKIVEPIEIKGVTLHIRPLTITQATKVNASDDMATNVETLWDTVANCLCTPDGNPIPGAKEKLDRLGMQMVNEIFNEICRISGMTPEGQDETLKN